MNDTLNHLAYEIELQPGERLSLPPALLDSIGPGRWIITIQPVEIGSGIRDHRAFLSGYASGDEDLYDDFANPMNQECEQ